MIVLLTILTVALALCSAWLVMSVLEFDRRVKSVRADLDEMSKDLADLEVALDDALHAPILRAKAEHNEQVAAWRAERDTLPEGSPKHTALTNRLREVGALDDGGGDAPEPKRDVEERSTDGGAG